MTRRPVRAPFPALLAALLAACAEPSPAPAPPPAPPAHAASGAPASEPKGEQPMPAKGETPPGSGKVVKSEEEWRRSLTPEQYHVLREKGTERAFTGRYWDTKTAGTYKCAGCGEPLFASDAKFDSGCGWPSFFQPLDGLKLVETRDTTHRMVRTEITCAKCGAHMGHVFNDGPPPTGLRYCINSVSIDLEPSKDEPSKDQPAK